MPTTALEQYSDTGYRQGVSTEIIHIGGVYMSLKSDLCPVWDGTNGVSLLRLCKIYFTCKSKLTKHICLMEWRDNNYKRLTPQSLALIKKHLTKAAHPIFDEFIHSLINLFGKEHIIAPDSQPKIWARNHPKSVARRIPAADDGCFNPKEIHEQYVLNPRLVSNYEAR